MAWTPHELHKLPQAFQTISCDTLVQEAVKKKKLRLDQILPCFIKAIICYREFITKGLAHVFYNYPLEYKKDAIWCFHLKVGKHFFTVRVMEQWHWFPREEVESPSLEILQDHMILGNLLEQGAGPGHLQMSLPALAILWSCKFSGFSPFIWK